jgi:hypothetical protein
LSAFSKFYILQSFFISYQHNERKKKLNVLGHLQITTQNQKNGQNSDLQSDNSYFQHKDIGKGGGKKKLRHSTCPQTSPTNLNNKLTFIPYTRTAVVEEGEQQKLGATEKRRSCKIEPIVLQMG